MRAILAAAWILSVGFPRSAAGNDTAASIAAGGVVPRKEPRVSMLRERLAIRMTTPFHPRVEVEYAFRNDGRRPVATEIAFPTAPRELDRLDELPQALHDFRAWEGGKELRVTKVVRALIRGKDQAPLLRDVGIDFEHFANHNGPDSQIPKLPPADFARLVRAGALDTSGWPLWAVETSWHWTQTFPPGKVVEIRHEYTPWAGGESGEDTSIERLLGRYLMACADAGSAAELSEARAAKEAESRRKTGAEGIASQYVLWVDYLLTTANSWKTPIGDFELTVDAPAGWIGTFCWKGNIERPSAGRRVARATGFVPSTELRVYFIGLL